MAQHEQHGTNEGALWGGRFAGDRRTRSPS